MHILLARYHLHLPTIHTLKEKRSILKRIIHALRSKHNVSVAEVGAQDAHQHAELAVVACSFLHDVVERTERDICTELETDTDARVAERQIDWL